MEMIAEIVISTLLVVGGIFGLTGSYGLIKLPSTMTRLHAPTKTSTLGAGGVLIASMIYFWVFAGAPSWHAMLITMFLLLTAPITANFIAKAYLHRFGADETLPETGTAQDWATFVEDEAAPIEPVMTRVDRP